MALDVGDKTIGIAFADETASMAFPGETIIRHEGHRRDLAVLRRLITEREVNRLVVGMPMLSDGSHGVQASKVEEFMILLRRSVRIPIELQDESYTTAGAELLLDEIGRKRSDQKRTIDSNAACLILQDFLAKVESREADVRQK